LCATGDSKTHIYCLQTVVPVLPICHHHHRRRRRRRRRQHHHHHHHNIINGKKIIILLYSTHSNRLNSISLYSHSALFNSLF